MQDLQRMNQRVVSRADGLAVAQKIGAQGYVECSAKTGEGVREVFQQATRHALMVSSFLYNDGFWLNISFLFLLDYQSPLFAHHLPFITTVVQEVRTKWQEQEGMCRPLNIPLRQYTTHQPLLPTFLS
jgi:hypothetical protein